MSPDEVCLGESKSSGLGEFKAISSDVERTWVISGCKDAHKVYSALKCQADVKWLDIKESKNAKTLLNVGKFK